MRALSALDLAIVLGYNLAVLAMGWGFFLRKGRRTSEHFMSAGRSLPGWAVGLSIFGSYVSSISFLANPGKAYADNWNSAVFAFSMVLAAWAAGRWFVTFYRRSGEVSAYQHLEQRFGPWARTYAVVCFLLVQLARLGTILYLLALALEPLLGCDIVYIILVVGGIVTLYPFLGGTEAVIWTGVFQALILVGGALACLMALLVGMPEGASQIFRLAAAENKFSLGSFRPSLSESTFWVVLVYGLVTHLQNFAIDQSYVQRYVTAASDTAARRSVWIGTWLFIPISLLFFFIGTALFAYYRAQPQLLPAGETLKADQVFPYFIAHELPLGIRGLVVAAICAAAMDSNLNCCATLLLCDVYRRYLRPAAGEGESLWVLRGSTLVMGALSVAAAIAMREVRTALEAWWKLAGIFSGGMLGLFLLGLLCRRAGRGAALAGVTAGVATILWLTFSPDWAKSDWIRYLPCQLRSMPPWRSPFHELLTLVLGTAAVLVVGWVATFLKSKRKAR